MNPELLIIQLYLIIEQAYVSVVGNRRLRQCGPAPQLTDAEAITIEVFGEMQGHHTDAEIWKYAKQHWNDYFPKLQCYASFSKQCANLSNVKQKIFRLLYPMSSEIHITDGFPMPVCHNARAKRCKLFSGEVSHGYCATKKEYYFGFKGHLVVDYNMNVVGFSLTAANTEERSVLNNIIGECKGLLIADKGYISKSVQKDLCDHDLNLQTPLRNNMKDTRPKSVVSLLKKVRRRVETAIGQLVETFDFACCKAKDLWHLNSKLIRKILAYNLANA